MLLVYTLHAYFLIIMQHMQSWVKLNPRVEWLCEQKLTEVQ